MDTKGKHSEVYRRWDDGFLLRRMRRKDVRQVIKWFESEGVFVMGPDLEVAFDMHRDNDDFCIGELNGEVIASCVVIQIADDLSYACFLYVVEQYRKMGFAHRILALADDIIRHRNIIGIIALDSMDYAQSMYEARGYEPTLKFNIYQGTVSANVDQHTFGTDIRQVITDNLDLGLLSFKSIYPHRKDFVVVVVVIA